MLSMNRRSEVAVAVNKMLPGQSERREEVAEEDRATVQLQASQGLHGPGKILEFLSAGKKYLLVAKVVHNEKNPYKEIKVKTVNSYIRKEQATQAMSNVRDTSTFLGFCPQIVLIKTVIYCVLSECARLHGTILDLRLYSFFSATFYTRSQ